MKKKVYALICALLSAFMLSSCGQNVAEEAAVKGKSYFDSGDYETAAKAFGVAVDNETTDEEVITLYDITLKYYQAQKEYEKNNIDVCKTILDSIDAKYENYGIKDSIVSLQTMVNDAIETREIMNNVAAVYATGDFEAALAAANAADTSKLSQEQVEQLNTIKTNSLQEIEKKKAEEEAARIEAEKKAAEQQRIAQQKAAAAANSAKKQSVKKSTQKKTSAKATKETPAPAKQPEKTPAQAPATNTVSETQAPAINTNVAADAYICQTDTVMLTPEQVATLSKDDIKLIKNEIYARKGHVFTSEKYNSYFRGKTWYTRQDDVTWSEFNDVEKANIRLLKEYEQK